MTLVSDALTLFDVQEIPVSPFRPHRLRQSEARWPTDVVLPLLKEAGITKRQMKAAEIDVKWSRPYLTDVMADRVACLLKRHPSALWPEWFDDVPLEVLEAP